MMNFDELRRLTQLLKMLKTLHSQQEILEWLRENKEYIRSMEPAQLEELREKADYDKDAWEEVLRQLLN